MRKFWMKAGLALAVSAGGAEAEQALVRLDVKTTPDKAWAAIGDFCGIKDWHPAVASCELKSDGKTQIRTLILKDGGKIEEQEVNWNNLGRAYSSKIVESPLPVEKLSSTLKVLPIDKKKIQLLSTSSFKPVGPAAEAEKAVSDYYLSGLKSLRDRLESDGK